jgi:hypothetical protein
MQSHAGSAIEQFFQTFELNRHAGNIPAMVEQYASVFLVAGPQGAQCVRGEDFALALPKRKQIFDSLGCQFTDLVSLEETPLNDRFVLVRTQWKMTFSRNPGNEQSFSVDSIFILDTTEDGFKIVFYLPLQDIFKLLKERGILPSA